MAETFTDLTGRIVDGFRVECLLGRGGMGEVWKAWDPRLERQVALKILAESEARDRDGAMRFEREAKAVSGISHPNIAHVYATGHFEGRPFYVMELIAGRSLGRILEEEGRIPGRRCLDFLRQAAEGLAEAYARGIVHRDVKPDNLMVDSEDRLKVVDFGLARRVQGDASLTQANMVVGTPKYMAPEQATGGSADHRSDIYSLGATFYHLFAGQAPFDAPTPVAVMMKHVHEPLVPLRERIPQVPIGVSAIVERMMAKEPAQRYQRYEDLIADVKRALSGASPRVVASTISLPATPPRATPVPTKSGTPWLPIGAMAVAIGILAFLAFRAGNDWKKTVSSPAPPVPAPTASRRAPPGVDGAPSEAPPALPVSAPSAMPRIAAAFDMAFHARSMQHMRKIATALSVYANTNEDAGLPASLDELLKGGRVDLHRLELVDGWGTPIRYARTSREDFTLTSAGPDRAFGGDDDIVMENGVVVRGDIDQQQMEERVRKIRGE